MAPPSRQELVALFANMVNSLGIKTLAEGVETRECHEILVEMGFELGQGFYYGRPSPISKYTDETGGGSLTDPELTAGCTSDTFDDDDNLPVKMEEI
jgi:EAL domain-containing protein (putative c-di-GMP-specific phosphodiesterase class I)